MDISNRRIEYLKASADEKIPATDVRMAAAKALCNMAIGNCIEENSLTQTLESFKQRKDCIDFTANILLRMFYLFGDSKLWSEKFKEELKSIFLDLDYWFNVERSPNSGKEIMWTENHIMLWHTSEYLICQLFGNEFFRGRKKFGKDILSIVKPQIEEWIDIKAKVGFSEWDSNHYMAENYMSLLNLYDFAEDTDIKNKAEKLLNLMSFGMAVNSYKGVYGCSHGRTYTKDVLNNKAESTRAIQTLLWNIGSYNDDLINLGGVTLALSSYKTPEVIDLIAKDTIHTIESREQQSFRVEDSTLFGKGFVNEEDLTLFWQNMGYTHKEIINRNIEIGNKYNISINHELLSEIDYYNQCKINSEQAEDCRCTTYLPTVNKITYKTGDYMLSCAQNYRKGERSFQQHIWQASLDDGVIVFTNHPGQLTTGGRPDLWIGNDIFPKAVQHENTLVCIYRIDIDVNVPYTHAYFPRNSFDEVCCFDINGAECELNSKKKHWIFSRKENGYIALNSQNGFDWSTDTSLEEVELICEAKENIWLCKLGNADEYVDFKGFIKCVLEWEIRYSGLHIDIEMNNCGSLSVGWEDELIVNSETVKINDYKRFENMFCTADRFSGEYKIAFEDKLLEIDFK